MDKFRPYTENLNIPNLISGLTKRDHAKVSNIYCLLIEREAFKRCPPCTEGKLKKLQAIVK
jgi:hypothetical protein